MVHTWIVSLGNQPLNIGKNYVFLYADKDISGKSGHILFLCIVVTYVCNSSYLCVVVTYVTVEIYIKTMTSVLLTTTLP